MPRPTNGKHRYNVHLSGAIADRLRKIQLQASLEGRGEAVIAAFRQIVHRLERDPLEFGEPLYRLPALRLHVRQGAIRPLFIDFAVHEDRPLVFIRGIKLLSK